MLVFVLLMCSCKSKEFARLINEVSGENSETGYTRCQSFKDTSSVLKIEIDKSKLKTIETIKITEYDSESGKPVKETETTRETVQDSDKVVSEEEVKGTSEVRNDSLNHFVDFNKMVESEVEEETKGGQEAFGKWFGIVIGCVIGLLVVYLPRKFRVN